MLQKHFHLGDILSITDGRLMSPQHIGGVYEILNFMTGDNLFTHQLPRAMNECKPYLLKQHPQLVGLEFGPVTPENFKSILAELCEKYGEHLPVEALPNGAHEFIDAISEMVQKMPNLMK